MTPKQIADKRNISMKTIEDHIAKLISNKSLTDISRFIDQKRYDSIKEMARGYESYIPKSLDDDKEFLNAISLEL